MSDVTIKARTKKRVEYGTLKVNLESETGKAKSYEYQVAKLGNKEALEYQLAVGEFARDEDRKSITSSLSLRMLFARVTPIGDAPEFISLFDLFDDDDEAAAKDLMDAVLDAAKASTVGA